MNSGTGVPPVRFWLAAAGLFLKRTGGTPVPPCDFELMNQKLKLVKGSIVAPNGFKASGVFCDIKRLGTGKGSQKGKKRDLTLIVSDTPAIVAGMFTTNQVCAAPVKVCLERVKRGI